MTRHRSALCTPPLDQRRAELTRLGQALAWNGLSPDAITALLTDDWSDAGPVHLDATVPLAALEGTAVMLTNARAMLRATRALGVAPPVPPPVQSGTRPERHQVFRVPGFVVPMRAGFKSLRREPLVDPRHWMQALLEIAGLLVEEVEGYALSERGAELLAAPRAGELYALLLHIFFRRFNLAYLDLFAEVPGLQDLVAHWLWHLTGPMGTGFTTADEYLRAGIPGPLMDQLQREAVPVRLRHLFQARVQDALADFGLLEVKPGSDEADELGDVRFRPTALLRRVVRIDITPPEPHSPTKLTLLH